MLEYKGPNLQYFLTQGCVRVEEISNLYVDFVLLTQGCDMNKVTPSKKDGAGFTVQVRKTC